MFASRLLRGLGFVGLPKLSPSMVCGKVVKWHVPVGGEIVSGELLCDIKTSTLSEDENSDDHVLEIEAHEDGWLADVLVAPDKDVNVGQPIFVFADNQSDVTSREDMPEEERSFSWQAYLKEGQESMDMCGKKQSE